MKKLSLSLVLIVLCVFSVAAQWTDTSGGISYTAGSVGIGRTPISPYRLSINGNVMVENGSIQTRDNGDWVGMSANNAASYSQIFFGDDTNDRLRFFFNHWDGTAQDKEIMTLAANGRVGIGVNYPDSPLEIRGTSSSNILHINSISGHSGLKISSGDTLKGFVWHDANHNTFAVGPGSFVNSVVFLNNNIGIGMKPTTHKLSVDGTIAAKEIIVTETIAARDVIVSDTNWADFVFEEDYDLKTLQQVKAYIDENGRLPEMPSAEEVRANGVGLAEMNTKLLQKVEELTLYTIEQESELQEQASNAAALEARIAQLEAIILNLNNEEE